MKGGHERRHGDRFTWMAPSILCAQEGIWGIPSTFRLVPGQPWVPRKEGGPSRWPGYWQPGHNSAQWGPSLPLSVSTEIFPNCGLGFLASSILERYAEIGRCLKMKYLKQCRNRGNGLIITWKDPHSGLCQTKWNRITACETLQVWSLRREKKGCRWHERVWLCEMESKESLGILGSGAGTLSSQWKLCRWAVFS